MGPLWPRKGKTMKISIIDKVVIRKDGFRPSKPWSADLYFKDDDIWVSWCYGYKTKKSLLSYIDSIESNIMVIDENVIRAPYKWSIDTDNKGDVI